MAEFVTFKYAYDGSGNIEYKGAHVAIGATENDIGWYITKFIYDSNSDITDKKGPKLGKWADRGTMF